MQEILDKTPDSPAKSRLSQIYGLGVHLTRRAVLGGTASGAAALGIGALWSNKAHASSLLLQPRSDLLMLVNRLLPGYSRTEYQSAQAMGFVPYRNAKLFPGTLNDSAVQNLLSPLNNYHNSVPLDYMPPPLGQGLDQLVSNWALQQKIVHYSILSKYQFRERIAECWRDHFNVFAPKSVVPMLLPTFDRDRVRPYVDGTFPQLLQSVEQSAAMLTYLDNQLNVAPTANENLAREILELHTLSPVDYVTGAPTYTQSDVLEFAKCISGWSVNSTSINPSVFGYFEFLPGAHIGGNKTVLGTTIPADPTNPTEGQQVLTLLGTHGATANFVAYKLCRFFLQYSPSTALVSQIAAVYQATGGDIRAMVQAILTQANVAALTTSAGPNLKLSLPAHWLQRVLIALELPLTSFNIGLLGLINELDTMGNAPYYWAAPDGYPDKEESWAGAIFSRWQAAAKLFLNPSGIAGVTISDSHLLGLISPFTTTMSVVNNIDTVMTGGVMTSNEKLILDAYINYSLNTGVNAYQIVRETFALAASTPTFLYY